MADMDIVADEFKLAMARPTADDDDAAANDSIEQFDMAAFDRELNDIAEASSAQIKIYRLLAELKPPRGHRPGALAAGDNIS